LQDTPKFTQIGIFGLKIYLCTGNPDENSSIFGTFISEADDDKSFEINVGEISR
jgi:hypothetical protein